MGGEATLKAPFIWRSGFYFAPVFPNCLYGQFNNKGQKHCTGDQQDQHRFPHNQSGRLASAFGGRTKTKCI